jgi:hypothetical protein
VPVVIPPGFGQAAFVFSSAKGTPDFITTLGVDISGAGGDFVSAANALKLCYVNSILGSTDNDLTLQRVDLAIGQDGPGGSVSSSTGAVQGGSSAEFGPVAGAVIAQKVTNAFGRKGRGRMFLPGTAAESVFDESGRMGSNLVPLWQANLTAFYDCLVTPAGGGVSYQPVILHSTAPTTPTPVVGFRPGPLIGWIRGRIW